jgi:hypothetical protein
MFEIAQPAVALHGTNSNKAAESPGSDWANFIIYELPIINVRNSAASCRTARAPIRTKQRNRQGQIGQISSYMSYLL